jgi:hypothetical protein
MALTSEIIISPTNQLCSSNYLSVDIITYQYINIVSYVRRQTTKVDHSIVGASLFHPSRHMFYDVSIALYPY